MIKDLRIHGETGGDKEFFATLCGEDVGSRYFHEIVEREGQSKHRFFLGGSEFVLGVDGLSHTGNGGSFCPYMFGVDEPIEDLLKPEVINRLVLFGALHGKSPRIRFTDQTAGTENYRDIFLKGHAVFNYFFFAGFSKRTGLGRQQEVILRILGRILKRFPLNLDEDDSRVVTELKAGWSDIASAFFLLKLVNRSHLKYYRHYMEMYSQSQTPDEQKMESLDKLAAQLGVDPYSQERMKIDVMYRHPENRQVVEEYRSVLINIHKKDEVGFDDRARISRLRTVALRRGIPVNLLNSLDDKLLRDKRDIQSEEPAYLVEVRGVLETIFLQTKQVGVRIEKEDLIKLLKSKLSALENRDSAFDLVLIEVGKQCDDASLNRDDPSILEEFGNIVTYFDRFDAIYHTVNRLAFHEEEKPQEGKLRSLFANKKVFDGIQENLFHDLFIVPVLKNPYLPAYGKRKVESLFDGLEKIETGDRSLQDLSSEMDELAMEEREYRIVKSAMERWLKKFGRSLRGSEEEQSFVNDVRKMLVSRSLVRSGVQEAFFRKSLEDLKIERLYINSVLPKAIRSKDADVRSEFIRSSGIDMIRVEELEREFQRQYRLGDEVMDVIRSART